MLKPEEIYKDGYHAALAGHGLLAGNPHNALTDQWHDWRAGWLLGYKQKKLRESNDSDLNFGEGVL